MDQFRSLTLVSSHAIGVNFAGGRLLLLMALVLWTGGYQAEVWAQEVPGMEAGVPAAVSAASSTRLGQKGRLLAQIVREVDATPSKAPDIVRNALVADLPNPIVFAGQVVQCAIHALLRPITREQISALILAATKARPPAVLEIVRAAIRATPNELHGEIVAEAVAGVPDPNSLNAEGKTLAEAILDAALKAGSVENREALSASINSALGSTSDSPAKTGTSTGSGSSGITGGGGGSGLIESPIADSTPTSSPSSTPPFVPEPTPLPTPTATP